MHAIVKRNLMFIGRDGKKAVKHVAIGGPGPQEIPDWVAKTPAWERARKAKVVRAVILAPEPADDEDEDTGEQTVQDLQKKEQSAPQLTPAQIAEAERKAQAIADAQAKSDAKAAADDKAKAEAKAKEEADAKAADAKGNDGDGKGKAKSAK